MRRDEEFVSQSSNGRKDWLGCARDGPHFIVSFDNIFVHKLRFSSIHIARLLFTFSFPIKRQKKAKLFLPSQPHIEDRETFVYDRTRRI